MQRPLAIIGFTYIFTLIAASFLSFASNCAISVFFIIFAFIILFALPHFNGKKIGVWRTIAKELTEGFLTKHNINAVIVPFDKGINVFLKDGAFLELKNCVIHVNSAITA